VSAELVARCGKCGRYPIDHRGGVCIYPRQSAELAARRTAAAAVAADFHTAAVAFQRGGEQPDYAVWAQRLERHLLYVLDALAAGDGDQAAAQLAEVRALLDRLTVTPGVRTISDRCALEAIDAIANRGRS